MGALRVICLFCAMSAAAAVLFGATRTPSSLGGAVVISGESSGAVTAADLSSDAGTAAVVSSDAGTVAVVSSAAGTAVGMTNAAGTAAGVSQAPDILQPAAQNATTSQIAAAPVEASFASLRLTDAEGVAPSLPLASMEHPTAVQGDIVPLSVIEGEETRILPDAEAAPGEGALAATAAAPVFTPNASVTELAPARSLRPQLREAWAVPEARWDDHPSGARWTSAVLSALRGPGAALIDSEPRDIGAWCPGYLEASPAQRAAFWTGLISALAWHESTHQPRAVGGGGLWYGLVQIAPPTAEWRNCDVETGEALLNGAANLRCGIRIMAITVPRDNVVSEGFRGVAADWGPFHSRRKREDMRNWVRNQSYCQAPIAPMRPVMRPAGLGEAALSHPSGPDGPELEFEPLARGAFRPVPRP